MQYMFFFLLLFYCRHSRNKISMYLTKPDAVCYSEKQKKQMRTTKTFLLWIITSLSCVHWSDRDCSCCSLLRKVVVPLCTRIWRIFMTTGCAVWYFCISDRTVVNWHGVCLVVTPAVAVLVCASWHHLDDMTGHIFCCRYAKTWLWEDSIWRTTNLCPSMSALTMMTDGQAVMHDLSNDSKSRWNYNFKFITASSVYILLLQLTERV